MAYDAFISYRHGVDGDVAAAVERGLERIARPWNRVRAMSVFRDQSDLGAESDLTGTITETLDSTRYLVLLASPESAASRWVEREVTYWCDAHNGSENVIVVVTGGELEWDEAAGALSATSTAVSPVVRSRFITEPLYVDLRWARSAADLSLRDTRFRSAIVRVAATIRGVTPADLESEDVRLHRRARRLARAAVASVVVLALVASIAAIAAVANSRRADRRARDAVGRQVGLAALDMPASEVDSALLLSLAAAELDSDRSGEQFHASRALIGRYSRLEKLLYAPAGMTSIRDVAISPTDERVVATLTNDDEATSVLTWPDATPSDPERIDLGRDVSPAVAFLGDGSRLAGSPGGDMVQIGDGNVPDKRLTNVRLLDSSHGLVVTVASKESTASNELTHVATGRLVARFTSRARLLDLRHGHLVFVADLTSAGRIGPSNIGMIDVATGATASATPAATTDVAAVAAGPSDGTAAVVASGSQLVVFSWTDGRLVPGEPVPIPEGVGQPRQIVVSPDGSRALAVGTDGSAVVNLTSGETDGLDLGSTGIVAVDPSGQYAAVGGARLTIWDLTTGRSTFSVPEAVNDMAWNSGCPSEHSCKLATVGESLDVWTPETRHHVELVAQTNAQAVAISLDGSKIVTAGWGRTVAVWNLRPIVDDSARSEIASADIPGGLVACGTERRGDLHAVSPGGSFTVAHSPADGITSVCDSADGSVVATARLRGFADPPGAVAVDESGNVAVGGGVGFVERFARDGRTFKAGTTINVRLGNEPVDVTAVAYNAGTIAAGINPAARGATARVFVWPVDDGGTPAQFETDHVQVPAVALLGNAASSLAVAGRDRDDGDVTLQIWETATRRRLGHALSGLTGDIVALTGDESAVVAADAAGAAFRWELDLDPTGDICEIVGRTLTEEEWNTLAGGALRRYDRDDVCAP